MTRRLLDEFPIGDLQPLAECEGHCESSDDCEQGLLCWYRDSDHFSVPPGCWGDAHDDTTNYCYDPDRRTLAVDQEEVLENCDCLSRCEGHCVSDAECAGDLKCWHRSVWTDPMPPRCRGRSPGKANNYCYDPHSHSDNAVDVS